MNFKFEWLVRLLVFVLMIFVFLTAIRLFGQSIKALGSDTARDLFSGLENPFAGLAVGILATVLVQSSSVTTSTVVAMVGSGTLPLAYAVPVVMGANIGTSITNTIVSLGHMRQGQAFRRAFAGATVHDIFNLLTVLILFPIELATGYLRTTAIWLVSVLPIGAGGGSFKSPVNTLVKASAGVIESFISDTIGLDGLVLAIALLVVALAMLIGSLVIITKNMRALMADRIEQWLNRILRRSGLLGLAIGTGITMLVQSSSITTSLLIPMFGAGVLSLDAAFPIMLGANLGTTITAMLAAAVTGPLGLTIAMVHLLFNLTGTCIFLPVKRMRRIPIFLAEKLAETATENRAWAFAYVVGTFIVAPILGIIIWK